MAPFKLTPEAVLRWKLDTLSAYPKDRHGIFAGFLLRVTYENSVTGLVTQDYKLQDTEQSRPLLVIDDPLMTELARSVKRAYLVSLAKARVSQKEYEFAGNLDVVEQLCGVEPEFRDFCDRHVYISSPVQYLTQGQPSSLFLTVMKNSGNERDAYARNIPKPRLFDKASTIRDVELVRTWQAH